MFYAVQVSEVAQRPNQVSYRNIRMLRATLRYSYVTLTRLRWPDTTAESLQMYTQSICWLPWIWILHNIAGIEVYTWNPKNATNLVFRWLTIKYDNCVFVELCFPLYKLCFEWPTCKHIAQLGELIHILFFKNLYLKFRQY